MTDKKTFGSFIKAKRVEKNFSQKDLAEQLFVTEGAVSKWERGVSYPDITLIAALCRVLEVSEHELITASTDTDTRKLKREAHSFRVIRGAWFWVPTISYAVALIPCFICNLAINHTLSWFFIVLAALLCAYTFVPTVSYFFRSNKLLIFAATTLPAICLLLFTCAVYTKGLFWLPTACLGVLMGYVLLFLPILLRKTRYNFLLAFTLLFLLTLLLLCSVHAWCPFPLGAAMCITGYAYLPVILCTALCTLRFNGLLKVGVCTLLCTVAYYFTGYVVNGLFGLNENHYQVDFHNWATYATGNVHLICLLSFLSVAVLFLLIGWLRVGKKKRRS